MPTRITYENPNHTGPPQVIVDAEEPLGRIVDLVHGAAREGKKFIVVMQAGGDARGKRMTVPASAVTEIEEL